MIASNYNWRFDFTAFHQLVHRNAELGALAVTEPANPRGQSLKLNPFAGELYPARKLIGARDIFGVAAQCDPAKWPAPFAKKRTNIFGNKPGYVERILYAGLFRLRADIVPVIESDRAFLLQSEHGIDVNGHRVHRSLDIFVRIFSAQRERVFERYPVRHVAVQCVMRAGLIG